MLGMPEYETSNVSLVVCKLGLQFGWRHPLCTQTPSNQRELNIRKAMSKCFTHLQLSIKVRCNEPVCKQSHLGVTYRPPGKCYGFESVRG